MVSATRYGASVTIRLRVYSLRFSYRCTDKPSIGCSSAVSMRPTGPAPITCTWPLKDGDSRAVALDADTVISLLEPHRQCREAKRANELQARRSVKAYLLGYASAVVDELHREIQLGALDQGDHRLQVVLLLRRDAELVALDLDLNALRGLVADQLADLLGLVGGDALLDAGGDLDLATGRSWVAGLQCLERDAALDQLALEHVEDGERAVFRVGAHLYAVLALPLDRGAGVLEVEPLRDLARGLVQGVVDLLTVDLAHDVERRVAGHRASPSASSACYRLSV